MSMNEQTREQILKQCLYYMEITNNDIDKAKQLMVADVKKAVGESNKFGLYATLLDLYGSTLEGIKAYRNKKTLYSAPTE